MSFVKRHKYFFGSLSLAAVLVLPWGLSVVSPSLEPYPAVIMPSGEAKVDLDGGTTEYQQKSIWAQREAGDWERVAVTEFLSPIPSQYFSALTNYRFGLRDTGTQTFGVRLLPDISVRRNKVSAAETNEAKIWLAARLRELGYQADEFEIRSERQLLNHQTGDLLEIEVTDVQSYNLR